MKLRSNKKDKGRRGRPKQKGKRIKWGRMEREGGRTKLKGKKVKLGRRERQVGKGIKNRRGGKGRQWKR